MKIRIAGVPPGEAPEEVRRAWVGLTLPLAPGHPRARTIGAFGVLSGPRTIIGSILRALTGRTPRVPGYLVRVTDAIAVLEGADPGAAAWWRENTPHLFKPGRLFGFTPEVCEEVG